MVLKNTSWNWKHETNFSVFFGFYIFFKFLYRLCGFLQRLAILYACIRQNLYGFFTLLTIQLNRFHTSEFPMLYNLHIRLCVSVFWSTIMLYLKSFGHNQCVTTVLAIKFLFVSIERKFDKYDYSSTF